MNQSQFGNTAATKSIKDLLSKIYDATSRKDSIYEQAASYFSGIEQQAIDLLEEQQTTLQRRLDDANKGARAKLEAALLEVRQQLKEKLRQQQDNRVERVRQVKQLSRQLLSLVTGETPQETRQLSARALGTIQLLSPTHGKHVALINQRQKHAYKAILALRLLDQLLEDQLLKNRYVMNKFNDAPQLSATGELVYSPFIEDVQLPLISAMLLQDIGLQHPHAQHILRGEDGTLDEYRTLTPTERQQLLTISYEQSQLYLKEGLGLDNYMGNSKTERELFIYMEQDKLNFISHLLKSAIQPEEGIGNLLKIPQVYVSVVLPSKANYQYEQLPKVSALLKAGVAKGWYPSAIVDSLLKITGYFPQGYGITYIPKDSDKQDLDRYEYAIVNGLYPLEPEQPICRAVTRNLTYNTFGINVVVSVDNNLYFQSAQQKLEKMSEERLQEILSKLVSNLEERSTMDLIPKCWHPDEFFTYLKNQNLWNRVDTIRN